MPPFHAQPFLTRKLFSRNTYHAPSLSLRHSTLSLRRPEHGRPASNNCAAMDAAPPQHAPAGAPLPPPPSVANDNLKRLLPPCTAQDPTLLWSAAWKRLRNVEFAHDNDGTATAGEVALHHQYVALVEARLVAGSPYSAPTDTQLAAQMQKMHQQMQQQMQQMQQMEQQTQQQMQQMQQQMQKQLQQTQQQMQKQHVQQMNVWSYRPEDPVANFPSDGMEPAPACFPDTVEALKTLSYVSSGTCLQYYGLPLNGNVDARRGRLAAHLGVRLHNNVFQTLEDRLRGLDRQQQRSEARQRNFATWNATDAIVPFLNDAGDPLPASFPATKQGMLDLPDQGLNELYSYYGIDGGDMRKLAHFLGVPSRNINDDQSG
jgi:DNA-binding transcriptional MerR regulator